MAVVETVRGPAGLGNLGQTLMHQHVFVPSTEHMQNYGSDWWDEEAMVARAAAAPNWHYEHITDDVLPALLASGVTQEQIDTMMVENPVRYFTPAKDGAS